MNCLVFTKVRNKEGIMFRAGLYGNEAAYQLCILCVKWSNSALNFDWYVFSVIVMVYFFPSFLFFYAILYLHLFHPSFFWNI